VSNPSTLRFSYVPGGQPAADTLERLADHLVHVEIAVGAAPADELHLWFALRELLVAPVQRLRGTVAGLDRVIALHPVVAVGALLLPGHGLGLARADDV